MPLTLRRLTMPAREAATLKAAEEPLATHFAVATWACERLLPKRSPNGRIVGEQTEPVTHL
jgi:hypothetical protein